LESSSCEGCEKERLPDTPFGSRRREGKKGFFISLRAERFITKGRDMLSNIPVYEEVGEKISSLH